MNVTSAHALPALPHSASLQHWGPRSGKLADTLPENVTVDCGWGRLIMAHTFSCPRALADTLLAEAPDERDVALYVRNPQVVVAQAPQDLFIDPSFTYRLPLDMTISHRVPAGMTIRPLTGGWDESEVSRIYKARNMVPLRPGFTQTVLANPALKILVAQDQSSGQIIACVMGVDHARAFDDPDNGASLWALATDPRCDVPGLGRAMVTALAGHFRDEGRHFMDLSVMHDNTDAIQLYESLGFQPVPAYCVKKKNAYNAALYVSVPAAAELNPYARIIVDEAARRGIRVEIENAALGLFSLTLGGRTIHCRESLSDLTSAVAMARCADKALTHDTLRAAGLCVPTQQRLETEAQAQAFLRQHRRIVIKPADGEQGQGVSVDLKTAEEVHDAWQRARAVGTAVLGETFVTGQDLRILVINGEVVAAALRQPPTIVGDGKRTVAELIARLSHKRLAATHGESRIPLDDETRRCVLDAGYAMEEILPAGTRIAVRKTANLHTGATLHDVTARLHPSLRAVAIKAAQALHLPVAGLDLIVSSPEVPDYVLIEANERPGLANHEPQPTAERFIDMLFPETATRQEARA